MTLTRFFLGVISVCLLIFVIAIAASASRDWNKPDNTGLPSYRLAREMAHKWAAEEPGISPAKLYALLRNSRNPSFSSRLFDEDLIAIVNETLLDGFK